MRLAAKGLTKSFDGKIVFTDVSMDIGPGVSALVGPNGSGKTTLMRILALLEHPNRGSVEADGAPAWPSSNRDAVDSLHRRMVLVHNPAVMLSGSVRYNLEYGLRVRGMGTPERLERTARLAAKLGLTGLERRNARTLSAGETQRLALARALATGPEMVFLDEPTANLDPASARIIETAIADLAREGTAVVLATHNLWQVERLADWLGFLSDGGLSLSGDADKVLHQGDASIWSKFLGRDNLYSGLVSVRHNRTVLSVGSTDIEVTTEVRGQAMASLNPTEIILSNEPLRSSARNLLRGTVRAAAGEAGLYRVTVDAGIQMVAAVTKASWDELELKTGGEVYAVFKATAVRVWREE